MRCHRVRGAPIMHSGAEDCKSLPVGYDGSKPCAGRTQHVYNSDSSEQGLHCCICIDSTHMAVLRQHPIIELLQQ
jgi:hypothetical protein